MNSTRKDFVSAIDHLIRRDRLWAGLGLFTAIVLAWLYLRREAAAMEYIAGMTDAAGMGLRAAGSDWVALFAMWSAMMVGMMLPSASPVILSMLAAYRLRRDARARASGVAFVGGYLLMWTTFSALAATAQLALHRAALLNGQMRLRSALLSGVVLLLVGVYQWLPMKDWCLVRCQAPLAFFTQRWRSGVGGALGMGAQHGLHCIGCCGVMMTLLFAMGVMNLAWVGALAAFVVVEKLSSHGAVIGRLGGAAAACWGIYLAGWQ